MSLLDRPSRSPIYTQISILWPAKPANSMFKIPTPYFRLFHRYGLHDFQQRRVIGSDLQIMNGAVDEGRPLPSRWMQIHGEDVEFVAPVRTRLLLIWTFAAAASLSFHHE